MNIFLWFFMETRNELNEGRLKSQGKLQSF